MNLSALTIEQQQALNAVKDLDRYCRETPERLQAMHAAAEQNLKAAVSILSQVKVAVLRAKR